MKIIFCFLFIFVDSLTLSDAFIKSSDQKKVETKSQNHLKNLQNHIVKESKILIKTIRFENSQVKNNFIHLY